MDDFTHNKGIILHWCDHNTGEGVAAIRCGFIFSQSGEFFMLARVTCKGFRAGSDNLQKTQIKIIWYAKHVNKSVVKDCCFNQ